MIYLSIACLIVIVLAYAAGPQGEMTHAAVSGGLLSRVRRFPLAAFYKDVDGNPIDLSQAILAKATGSSCLKFGIRDGAVVIAKEFDASHDELTPGQLVIINSPREDGSRPQRFRCVHHVDGDGLVHFVASDRSFKAKPLEDVIGKVTHVSS